MTAAIVLADADPAGILTFTGLMYAGQACVAQSRLLVPRAKRDEIVAAMIEAATYLKAGLPDDPEPARTANHREAARPGRGLHPPEQGGRATAVLDGVRPDGLESGYFRFTVWTWKRRLVV